MFKKLLVVFLSTFFISKVCVAKYAHVRAHDADVAILFFDIYEEKIISNSFPSCVTRIWKNNLPSHLNYFRADC